MDKFSQNDYTQMRNFLSREFGLYFEPSKLTYLENRIIPLLNDLGCADLNQFIANIQAQAENRTNLLNLLTTNETWFFRHPRHFDILRDEVVPALIRSRKTKQKQRKSLAIWSAGCSIGAELFSILITLLESIENFGSYRLKLLGTDISSEAIARALAGVYSRRELKLLSKILLAKYFLPHGKDLFKIKPEFQELVEFEQMNLLDTWPARTFDVIFCRNTMIYFHEDTKAKLTERFFKILNFQGTFFTSATETFHWHGEQAFKKIYIHGEYIYRKASPGNSAVLFYFSTPSDLLRALNLMVKLKMEYHLKTVIPSGFRAPRKALYVPKPMALITERAFRDASLAIAAIEEIII